MSTLEEVKNFLNDPAAYVAKLKSEQEDRNSQRPEDRTDTYAKGGVVGGEYQMVPHTYEAIQVQSMEHVDGNNGNLPEVVAFLMRHNAQFYHCKHGHLYLLDADGKERLEDGDWVITREYKEGRMFITVGPEDFRNDFHRTPFAEPINDDFNFDTGRD